MDNSHSNPNLSLMPTVDGCFAAMQTWGYRYVITKDAEGFWVHTDDEKYFERNVLAELRRKALDLVFDRYVGDERVVKRLIERLSMSEYVMLSDFKPDPRLVLFKNGVYYLDHHQFVPTGSDIINMAEDLGIDYADYRYKTFTRIPHDFNLEAESKPEWDSFVSFVFGGDQKAVQTFYEWLGYCLTTKINKKKMLLILGCKDSGKTTLSAIALNAIGRANYSIAKFYQLCSRDLFVRYNLIEMRVNYDDDIGKNKIEAIDEVKDLTGDMDEILVNPKHEKPYKHYYFSKLWLLANNIPYIKNLDLPIAGRFLLLRAVHKFSNSEKCSCGELHPKDETFKQRMIEDEGLAEYIIVKAILAFHELEERRGFMDQSDVEILDVLRLELEPVYRFLKTKCKTDCSDQQSTPQPELYEAFVEWLDDEGTHCYVDTQRKFTEQMAAYGYRTTQVQVSGWDEVTQHYKKNIHRKVYKGVALQDSVFYVAKDEHKEDEGYERETIEPFKAK